MRRLVAVAAAIVAVVLVCAALLVLIPAQTTTLWKLEIVAREQGHWFALVGIVAGLALVAARGVRGAGATLAALAATVPVLLLPLGEGLVVARSLDERLGAFGPAMQASDESRPAPAPRAISYTVEDGQTLTLDFTPGAGATRAPLVIIIHGGSWRGGTRADLPELGQHLARRGYAVAAITYRFAPTFRYPAARHDVRRAIEVLKQQAPALDFDSSRIVLIGRSAGGHLALLSAYADADPAIRGVVALYPAIDLRWGYEHPSNPRVLNSTATLEAFLGGSPTTVPGRYADASPTTHASAESPPTLLIHGARDELVSPEHIRRLGARLEALGRPHLEIELPWATHGCDYFIAGPCGRIVRHATERFVAAVTR